MGGVVDYMEIDGEILDAEGTFVDSLYSAGFKAGGSIQSNPIKDTSKWTFIHTDPDTYTYGTISDSWFSPKDWNPRPDQCPHCLRDKHPGPLTERVAQMYDSHSFDSKYDPDADESPILCVGSEFQGPPRSPKPVRNSGFGMGYSQYIVDWPKWEMPVVKFDMEPWYKLLDSIESAGKAFAPWQQAALNSWVVYDEPKELECADIPDELDIEFKPENWPVEHATPAKRYLKLISKVWDKFQELGIPEPDLPESDYKALAKTINESFERPKGKK